MDFFSSQLSKERSELRSTKKALEETILKLEVHTLGPFSRIFLNDVPMLLSTFWPFETRTYLKHEHDCQSRLKDRRCRVREQIFSTRT